MNMINYIKYYGDYEFKDKPFNEIDNIIFSYLSYVNFNDIININDKLTINELIDKYFSSHNKKTDRLNILAVKQGTKVLKSLKDVKRFKDIIVSNYVYIGNESSQFSAMSFEISKDLVYVAFEGTDQLISGWKEDCKMAYSFPVEAHKYAVKYLNRYFTFNNKNLIVGGHSKGGNLALVGSMYSNFLVRRKIVSIYSNDGQGLRKAQIESKNYNKIKDRFQHIIPHNSIVGLLLRHDNNNIIVNSNRKGFMAHDAMTWQVDYDHFKRDNLSKFSQVLDDGVIRWLDKYDDIKREKFVNSVFVILEENNIESLIQLKQEIKLIFKVIKSSANLDPIVKEMLLDLFKVLSETNKEYLWF